MVNLYEISEDIVKKHIDKFKEIDFNSKKDYMSYESEFISDLRKYSDKMFFV